MITQIAGLIFSSAVILGSAGAGLYDMYLTPDFVLQGSYTEIEQEYGDEYLEQVYENIQRVTCLQKNIYHEARGESYFGKVAVANVTLNRVKSEKFPNDVCSVVYDPKQFSWTHQNIQVPDNQLEKKNWYAARVIAFRALNNDLEDITSSSLWYHTTNTNYIWDNEMEVVAVIGNHKFFTN